MRRPLLLLTGVAVAIASSTGRVATAAAAPVAAPVAPAVPAYGAGPGPGAVTTSASYFAFDASPGDAAAQSILLTNPTTDPVELRLAPVDAATGPRGGISYGAAADDGAGAP